MTGALETVVSRAFGVAKRVRTETEIGRSAVSISFVAVELARQIFGNLDKRTVMILGAGKMSELAARHLRRAGASQIFVTNRTHDRAIELAAVFGGRAVQYDRYKDLLPEVDIVITSSAAPHYILDSDDIRSVIEARRNRPVFLIDIAVPRNIDPAVNELDNVFLYDIDDLREVADENLHGRLREAGEAESIIDEEVERMVSRLKVREVTPAIVGIRQHLEHLRVSELERVRSKLSSLSPEQREAVEAMTRGLVNKVAHGPISELRRQAARPDGYHAIEVISRLFRRGS
jgi:glutamyl-tRNA reductase